LAGDALQIDLMGLGHTEIALTQDVSVMAQVRLIAQVVGALGI
jgi:hypothetical protein